MRKVEYLGYHVSGDGISADPAKVQAVRDFPRPKDLKQVRSSGWHHTTAISFLSSHKLLAHYTRSHVRTSHMNGLMLVRMHSSS